MLGRFVVVAVAVGLSTAVLGQADVTAKRKDIMKENGQMARLGGQMAKGEVPFDPEKAKAIYVSFEKAAAEFPGLFPDNSKTGEKTTASPKIWEDKADFDKRFADWSSELKKAEPSTADLASFRTSFGDVTKACGSCHQVYRLKTS